MTPTHQALLETHVRFIQARCNWAMRRYPQLDRHELFSDLQLAACRAVERYEETAGASFRTYLANRLNGAVLDHVRIALNRRKQERPQFTELRDFTVDQRLDFARAVEASITLAALRTRLSARQNRVIAELLTGATQAEIALRLGVSHSNVRQVVDRAFRRMRA